MVFLLYFLFCFCRCPWGGSYAAKKCSSSSIKCNRVNIHTIRNSNIWVRLNTETVEIQGTQSSISVIKLTFIPPDTPLFETRYGDSSISRYLEFYIAQPSKYSYHQERRHSSQDLERGLHPNVQHVRKQEGHADGEDGGAGRHEPVDNAHPPLEVVAEDDEGRRVGQRRAHTEHDAIGEHQHLDLYGRDVFFFYFFFYRRGGGSSIYNPWLFKRYSSISEIDLLFQPLSSYFFLNLSCFLLYCTKKQ